MMILERIQGLIHKVEVESGARRLNYLVLVLVVTALAVWYDTHCYHSFNAPEAMDAAQVARNLAEGRGFTTECIRPFSAYLIQKHKLGAEALPPRGTNLVDFAEVYGPHPDLANAPLYPAILAGFFKITSPDWKLELQKSPWGGDGHFSRYKPEFMIAIGNQLLLLAAILLTFMVARTLFDTAAAWLAALLMFGSDILWKLSVSGLPTLLLLVIFLGLTWCLTSFEAFGCAERPDPRRGFVLALAAGLLVGLGMLTRYSFGWVIGPVIVYFAAFGGPRRIGMALVAFLVFAATVAPWVVRNLAVSGTFFGTAGYAMAEGTMGFPGPRLMQSLNPNMTSIYWILPYLVKLQANLRDLLQNSIPALGGGWIGMLFLTGLLLGLRNVLARRLRYFAMMCAGVFLIATALGQTPFTALSPDVNGENLLVLLTPLAIIFGLAFFLTLLNQMDVPSLGMRFLVVGVVVVLACQQFIITLLPPKTQLVSFPPYNPEEIQRCGNWLHPNELMMSDIPWAVAWYGDRQCAWTTINARLDFYQFNDYTKHVSALYLTRQTLDAKLFSDCLQGGVDSWYSFVFERIGVYKIKNQDAADAWGGAFFRTSDNDLQKSFPLRYAPSDMISGLFLADRPRWQTE